MKAHLNKYWYMCASAAINLCKPIHDIINYTTSICPFESEKCEKETQTGCPAILYTYLSRFASIDIK